jgi:F420 biosynthesis protein FbiB-like protein
MDFHSFLRSRRSVRRFAAAPVSAAALQRMIETATYAPSSHNRQPWRFAVLTDASTKAQLAEAMAGAFRRDLGADGLPAAEITGLIGRSKSRIQSAPVVIVLCMDMSEMDAYPDSRRQAAERTMALQSTSLAGLQLLLAAHAEGLGGVWNCAPLFAPREVSEALGLPETWEPQGMILVGIPAETPAARPRRPVHEIAIIR